MLADEPDVRAAIDLFSAWTEARIAYWAVPSVAIAVVQDQQIVWAHTFGWADVDRKIPATPETLYRIGSITKLFTATAIMQLRDAGALRLDDPIVTHLPWFRIGRGEGHGHREITIRHVLTHTSGLPRDAPFPYWETFQFPSIDEVREALPRQSTIVPIDTRWKYSNLAFVLAGEIVATVSGLNYADYIERRILAPLGMTSTLVRSPAPDDPRLALGYGRRFPRRPRTVRRFTDLRGLTAAGNMTSSVLDLARFAMLQFRAEPVGGAKVLAATTLEEMRRLHWLEPGWKAGWGLGFRLLREGDRTCAGHGGSVAGYAGELRLVPDAKIGIAVLTNAEDSSPILYAQRVTEWIVPAIAAVLKPHEPATPIDETLKPYIGRYRNEWEDMQVIAGRDGLQLIAPFVSDPMAGSVSLVPVAPHTFRIETQDGFGTPDEMVKFEVDAAGKVTRAMFGEHAAYPVNEW